MKVLVDTSVWSMALRRNIPTDDPRIETLGELLKQEQVVLCGIILQEILQGIRDDKRFRLISDYLQAVPLIDLAWSDFIEAARIWNLCRSNGVQASTVDCQIASVCVRYGCALLTADQDFQHIARYCPLQLL